MFNVLPDRHTEQSRFLRDQTNLLTKPLYIEGFQITAIQSDNTLGRIVESFG